jgi:hypothetical protein
MFADVTCGAVAVGVLLTSPPAALAAGSIQFTGGSACDSTGNGGFVCYFNVTGGTTPYTATWSSSNGWATVTRTTVSRINTRPIEYEIGGYGSCTIGTSSYITLRVSDSAGHVATTTGALNCTAGSEA